MTARPPVLLALALTLGACPGPEVPDTRPDATPALSDAGLADGALRFDARVGDLGPVDAGGEVALDDVEPRSGVISGGYRVRLSGEGFTTGMQVRFGDRLADNLLLQNSRSVTVRVPAGAASGPVDVTVDNGAHQATLEAGFVYFDALVIDRLQPSTVLSTGGTSVVVDGAGFVGELLVLVGGRAAAQVEVVDEHQLRLIAPPGTPGRVHVEILSTYGRVEAPLALRYVAPLRLERAEPAAGPQAGGSVVTLHGEGFGEETTLRVGNTEVGALVRIDGARLRFTAPPSSLLGAVDLVVQDPFSSATLVGGFAYLPAPSSSLRLDAVVPAQGDVAGGDERRLLGAGLDQGPLDITFDGVPAELVAVDGATALRVRTPAHAEGSVDVRVASASQSATLPGAYTYRPLLGLGSVEPASGPGAGDTSIVVHGRGFTTDTQLRLGGQLALDTTWVDAGTLSARTPAGSAGAVDVEVVDPVRGEARLVGGFTYLAELGLVAVRPVRGGMAGDTYARIYGRGFASGAAPAVRFGTSAARDVVVLADNLLTARSPAHAPGVVDVSVTRGAELATVARAYTYYDPGSLVGGTRGGPIDGAMYVSCFHAITGMPLEGITVQLGTSASSTYRSLTDVYGQATLSGPDLHGPQTLSAAAAGYESITLVEVNAAEVSLFMYPTTMTPSSGQPPPMPPPPVISGRVYGFAKELFDPAALGPGESALCVVETTMRSIFSSPASVQSSQYVVQNGGTYTIPAARPGRLAVVAVAGIYNMNTQAFRPRQIGFARGVQAGYGDVLENVDVELTVPLNTRLDVTLPAMPYGDPDPESGLIMPFINLGGEGVYPLPEQQVGQQTQVTFADFPDLPGEMLTFLAGAFVLDAYRPCQAEGSCPYSVVVRDGVGDLSTGLALDPILGFPEMIDPPPSGVMTGNRMRWKPAPGTQPSYYEVYLMGLDGTAWDFYVPGTMSKLLVPSFPPLDVENPPGNTGLGAYQAWMIAVYVPGFAFDNFSYLDLSGTARRAWTQATFKFVNANTP